MNSKRNLCVTCLSSERCLFPLNKMALFIQELKFLKIQPTDHVCWECKHTIKKIHKFRNQVYAAKVKLNNVTHMENVKSLSNLVTSLCTVTCSEYRCNRDPLSSDNTDYKENFIIIEEYDDVNADTDGIGIYSKNNDGTDSSNDTDDIDNSYDSNLNGNDENVKDEVLNERKPEIDVNNHYNIIDNTDLNADSIQIETIQNETTEIDLVEEKIVEETDTETYTQKFIQVRWTDEEVARDREKKRNHPNFKKVPFKCESCVQGFTSEETFGIHVRNKHNENIGPHLCNICQVRFPTLLTAERHRQRHNLFYKCLICHHKSIAKWAASRHCKMKHERDSPDRIHCKKCDAVFKSLKDLEDHLYLKHAEVCEYCGDKFRGIENLRQHRANVHSANRQYVCDYCTKKFITKTRLETHLTRHVSASVKKLTYCNLCNIQFKNMSSYRAHLRTNVLHREKAHKCLKCDKRFTFKGAMRRHYEFYHLKKSKYQCDSCNKLFLSNWLLNDHKMKHHELDRVRNHPCTVCDKKFYSTSMLRLHMQTHSEQRSFMCEDCGDTFKQRSALYTHARLVHAAKRPSVEKKNNK